MVPLQQKTPELVMDLSREEAEERKRRENLKANILYEQKGFCKEGGEGDGY